MPELFEDATPTDVILHLLIASTYFCKMLTSRKGSRTADLVEFRSRELFKNLRDYIVTNKKNTSIKEKKESSYSATKVLNKLRSESVTELYERMAQFLNDSAGSSEEMDFVKYLVEIENQCLNCALDGKQLITSTLKMDIDKHSSLQEYFDILIHIEGAGFQPHVKSVVIQILIIRNCSNV